MTLIDIQDYFRKFTGADTTLPTYIFGGDEATLRRRINEISGNFLFVDFGEITAQVDGMNRLFERMTLAVTAAFPFGSNSVTEEVVVCKQNELLLAINEIARTMLRDQRCIPFLNYLSPSFSRSPFVAPDINRSIGWTLEFTLEGYEMLIQRK